MPHPHWSAAAAATVLCTALGAHAQTLLLDDFTAPSSAQGIVSGSQNYVLSTPGTFAGQAGQARDAYFWPYLVPGGATPSAQIGAGGVSAAVGGAGAYAELGLGWGAYGGPIGLNVNGPALGLDLSGYGELRASFAQTNHTLNLIVGLYTASPLPGGQYYWNGELNLSPSVPGGPAVGHLAFAGNGASTFNFKQVDGIVFIVDRAAQADGNAYTLSSLQFAQAVPEPAAAVLALAGLVVLLPRLRRAPGRERELA